jgi:hypothetical protein
MTDALIIYDGYGDSGAFEGLSQELISQGISYDVIPNLSRFEDWKKTVDLEKPVLFYRNEFIRIKTPREVLLFHRENNSFPYTTDTSWGFYQNISLKPAEVFLSNNFKLESKNLWSFIFEPENYFVDIARPDYEQVPIFVLAHNRPEYLKLTLNSLLHSTADQQNRKIVIIWNDATEEVKNLSLSYLSKDKNIEFLDIYPNAKLAAINVALQVYRPRKFIYCEDDVIFPEPTRNYFPQWVTQFASRLRDFDIVAWHYGTENVNIIHGLQRLHLPDYSSWLKVSEHEGLTIGGQCFCTSTDYFASFATENNNWTTTDKDLFRGNGYSPSLRLYHLGFNHRIDYPQHSINQDSFAVKNKAYQARKVMTGETYRISLEGIQELRNK